MSATGQEGETDKLKQYYKEYISKCISKNQSKANLQGSKSPNLRSCGAIAQQKVIFLTKYQNTLIDEMIIKKVSTKPYKLDYYLNKRFYDKYH